MVEWAGLLVGAVSLLLDRLDKRGENLRERQDIGDALLHLLQLLREWWMCATETNALLKDWVAQGCPADYVSIDNALRYQLSAATDALLAAGFRGDFTRSRRRKKGDYSVLTVLFAYDPELESQLRSAIDERFVMIAKLREAVERKVDVGKMSDAMDQIYGRRIEKDLSDLSEQDFWKLDAAAQSVEDVAELLASFISDHLELGTWIHPSYERDPAGGIRWLTHL